MDKQLTHAMHVKDRYVNVTFIDKLTKGISYFDWILVILYMSNVKTVGFSSKLIKVTSHISLYLYQCI